MPFLVEPIRPPEEEPSAFLREARLKLDTGHLPGTDKWVVDRENERLVLSQGGRSEDGRDRTWFLALDRNGRYSFGAEEAFAKRDMPASRIHRKVSLGWYSMGTSGDAVPGPDVLRWVEALRAYEAYRQRHFYAEVKLDVVDSATGEAL